MNFQFFYGNFCYIYILCDIKFYLFYDLWILFDLYISFYPETLNMCYILIKNFLNVCLIYGLLYFFNLFLGVQWGKYLIFFHWKWIWVVSLYFFKLTEHFVSRITWLLSIVLCLFLPSVQSTSLPDSSKKTWHSNPYFKNGVL